MSHPWTCRISALLLFAFATITVFSQRNSSLVDNYNRFAIDLLSELNKDGENVCVSPANVYASLNLLALTLDSASAREIRSALSGPDNADSVIMRYSVLRPARRSVFNSIWLSNNQLPRSSLFDQAQFFDHEVRTLDRSDSDLARQLNKWVDSKTGKSASALKTNKDRASRVYFVSAVAVTPIWLMSFGTPQTKSLPYFREGSIGKEIPFMSALNKFDYFDNDELRAIKIPVTEGMEFYVIQPHKQYSLEYALKNLSSDFMSTWNFQAKLQNVEIPIFKFEYIPNLDAALKKMTMKKVRSPLTFSNYFVLSPEPAEVTILQKVTVRVQENNDEEPAPRQHRNWHFVRLDRPFLFFVVDSGKKIILHCGIVRNPQ